MMELWKGGINDSHRPVNYKGGVGDYVTTRRESSIVAILGRVFRDEGLHLERDVIKPQFFIFKGRTWHSRLRNKGRRKDPRNEHPGGSFLWKASPGTRRAISRLFSPQKKTH
jgi:hypothetical protein